MELGFVERGQRFIVAPELLVGGAEIEQLLELVGREGAVAVGFQRSEAGFIGCNGGFQRAAIRHCWQLRRLADETERLLRRHAAVGQGRGTCCRCVGCRQRVGFKQDVVQIRSRINLSCER